MFDFLEHGTHKVMHDISALSSGAEISVAFPVDGSDVGVVLLTDVFGMRPLVDDTVTQLASLGIATIAVDVFASLQQEHSTMTREEKFDVLPSLDDNAQCANFLAAGQILRTQHNCTRVTLVGFCLGGMYAFKCAGTGAFDAVVSCYGMITIPEKWRGPAQREPLDYLAMESSSPVLAIVGGADDYASEDNLAKLRAVFESEHHKAIDSEIVVYDGARHAFMHDPEREEHRPQDAKDAWARVLSVIQGP